MMMIICTVHFPGVEEIRFGDSDSSEYYGEHCILWSDREVPLRGGSIAELDNWSGFPGVWSILYTEGH